MHLRRIRELIGLSVKDLAQLAEVKESVIYDLELGRRKGCPETKVKVCRALCLGEKDLFRDGRNE